ncbi:GntR family transcriptional regulator, transcriptional repressor for pyruvate dehydrogenase complex [Pollutimonas bauzanensis]|uniref:GntR family transcriptional regulator, transcriptional repressor for pyruvate dehydrogenase complex n=2 Tax=Pollutimonas bauzanensis TaxID=658167 RepID=A0A1M5ZT90_9BURK|nr:GntR family transcriptional regulator, transcriptional repressor for pyruvate dehydrogenase complex [Pollutimonas bauzanensis]
MTTMEQNADFAGYARLDKQNIPQQIVNQIQEHIAAQKLKTGDQLPSERELAIQLNVSRSAVREAVKILVSIEILEVKHGLGTFVKEPQLRPLTDLSLVEDGVKKMLMRQAIEVRALIDVEVTRLAAMHATPADIKDLEDYLAMSVVEPMKSKRKYGHDLGFEKIIAKAAKNIYLSELQKKAHSFFEEAWNSGGFIPRKAEERNIQHREIVDAIKNKNPDLAVRLMKEHMNINI